MKLLFSLFIGLTLMFAAVFFTTNLWAYPDGESQDHKDHAYHELEEDTVWLNPVYNSSENTTTYTTDTLDTPGSIRLHEIYFRLEYKDGILPNTNHFINAMSSDGHTAPASEFQLGVKDQNLIASCAFINREIEFNDADHAWMFTMQGNEPLDAIRTVATYRRNIAGSMPDYEGSQDVDLHTIDTENVLDEVTCFSINDFQALTTTDKVIILIHGWNPYEKDNHYGAPRDESDPLCLPLEGGEPEGEDDHVRNGFAFQHLMINLMNNPAVKDKWAVARYDWHNDAMTGEGLLEDSNASRDAAHVHGKKLGSLLASLNVEKVHFIAHSAGNWVARRASEYLNLYRGDNCEIQVTSLDPFVNDDADTIGIDVFDLEPDFELMPNFVDRLDNYYAIDISDVLGWTSGDFDGWLNQNIENLNAATCYLPFMKHHSGPIYWYAKSADIDVSQALKPLSLGFYNSLAWKEYLYVPPPTLTVRTSGINVSASWTSVSNATGYTLYYAPSPYTGPETIESIDMGTNTSVSIDLYEGAAFYGAVTAYNSLGSSEYSNIVHFDLSSANCGAYVAPGVWKQFDCYNLAAIGKTTNDNPFTPSWRLNGGYWQWGRKGPSLSQWYTTNTSNFAHGPTGSASGEANDGTISEWDQTHAPDGSWSDASKTANDPCPAGFRVPSKIQWDGVDANNTQSIVGTWSTSATNYSSSRFFGNDLMLPAIGHRSYYSGSLNGRGYHSCYWSSTGDTVVSAGSLAFYSGSASTNLIYRGNGFSVRCVAE